MAAAVVLISVASGAMIRSLDAYTRVEERIVATWVAASRMAELRILRHWNGPGSDRGEVIQNNRTWYFTEQRDATSDPDLLKVTISVFTDSARKHEAGELVGALVNPRGVLSLLPPTSPTIPVPSGAGNN